MVQWMTKMLSSLLADRLKRQKRYSPTAIAKMFNSIGAFGAALGLLLVSFDDCHHYIIAVLLICFATACSSFYTAGFQTSLVTIAPAYAGVVSSFTRITAATGAISGPLVVGMVTSHVSRAWVVVGIAFQGSQSEWRIVFMFMAAMMTITGLVFLACGSADVQPWAMPPTGAASTPSPVPKKPIDVIIGGDSVLDEVHEAEKEETRL